MIFSSVGARRIEETYHCRHDQLAVLLNLVCPGKAQFDKGQTDKPPLRDTLPTTKSPTYSKKRLKKKNLLPIDFNATYYPNTENTCTCIRPQQINPPLTRHVLSTCIQTDQSTYSGYNTRLLANRVRPPCDDADWIQIICKSFGRTVVWKR